VLALTPREARWCGRSCQLTSAENLSSTTPEERIGWQAPIDANASTFEVADYGIVGDLFQAVPALVAEITKAMG